MPPIMQQCNMSDDALLRYVLHYVIALHPCPQQQGLRTLPRQSKPYSRLSVQDSSFPKVASELPLRESRKLPVGCIPAGCRILRAPAVCFRGNPPISPSSLGESMFKRTWQVVFRDARNNSGVPKLLAAGSDGSLLQSRELSKGCN